MQRAGHEDVIVLEKANRVGGTWRENRYPGLACDVPAHAYTYEFAPNPEWSAYFAGGPEIQAYFEKAVDDYGVRSLIRFDSEVGAADWTGGLWRVATTRGDVHDADVVIVASGVLHHPNMPQIPGLDSFAGPAMHTARWDTAVDLAGKRIGVIGNGSTGVQMVAHLGLEGHDLVHFQRTPQWIMATPNFTYSDEDKARFRESVAAIDAVRYNPDFLAAIDRFTNGVTDMNSPGIREVEDLCRRNLEESVRDPALREKLRPNCRAACKRLIFSGTYYEAVQKPDVELVVGQIERNTIWSSGCDSYYLDKTGVPIVWPWTYEHFRRRTKAPDFAAFEFGR